MQYFRMFIESPGDLNWYNIILQDRSITMLRVIRSGHKISIEIEISLLSFESQGGQVTNPGGE
jgi:hypothetical protein